MASILLHVPSGNTTAINAALVAAGHTVTIVNTNTDLPASRSEDMFFLSWGATGRHGNVVDWLESGKPVCIIDEATSTPRICGITTGSLPFHLGIAPGVDRQRFFDDIQVIDNTHDVTAGFDTEGDADGTLVNISATAVVQGVITLPLDVAGDVLAMGDATNVCLAAGASLVAFPAGITIDTGTTPATAVTAAKAFYFGAATASTTYSATLATIIERIATWLLASGSSNTAPVVEITLPTDAEVPEGSSVTFEATATDAESGDISARIVWTSDLDGLIGTGASFSTASLSVGTHTITATVFDAQSLSGSDYIYLIVTEAPTDSDLPAPEYAVLSPVGTTDFPVAITNYPPTGVSSVPIRCLSSRA